MSRFNSLALVSITIFSLAGCGNTLSRTQEMITNFSCSAENFRVAKAEFIPLFKRQTDADDFLSAVTTGALGQLYAVVEDFNSLVSDRCAPEVVSRCALESRPFFTEVTVRGDFGHWIKQRTLHGPVTSFGIEAKIHRQVTPRGVKLLVDSIAIADQKKLEDGLNCFIKNAPSQSPSPIVH